MPIKIRLPNGYGSIRKLSGKRTRPFAVFAPSKDTNEKGNTKYNKPIAYAKTWQEAFLILTAYNNGNYDPNNPPVLTKLDGLSKKDLEAVVNEVIKTVAPNTKTNINDLLLSEAIDLWYKYKIGKNVISKSSIKLYQSSIKLISEYSRKIYVSEIKSKDIESYINTLDTSKSYKKIVLNILKQTFKYLMMNDYINKNPLEYVSVYVEDDTVSGTSYTIEELARLWKLSEYETTAKNILIYCYSGFRSSAYKTIEINKEEMYFKGGVKNKYSKNRIVPIHSSIIPFIESFTPITTKAYKSFLKSHGFKDHRIHDTRHTFSMLCEKFGVNENDRKRLLGHAFSDITNSVYGHRSIEDLRAEIEKINTASIVKSGV